MQLFPFFVAQATCMRHWSGKRPLEDAKYCSPWLAISATRYDKCRPPPRPTMNLNYALTTDKKDNVASSDVPLHARYVHCRPFPLLESKVRVCDPSLHDCTFLFHATLLVHFLPKILQKYFNVALNSFQHSCFTTSWRHLQPSGHLSRQKTLAYATTRKLTLTLTHTVHTTETNCSVVARCTAFQPWKESS